MANPITLAINGARKALAINLVNGARLLSGSYQGESRISSTSNISFDSDAGISIDSDKALNVVDFWACVTYYTKTLASLPFVLYEQIDERNKAKAKNEPLYRLLHDEPNPEMDSFSYMESLVYNLIANNGNCYSFIEYEGDGTGSPDLTAIKYLWPMDPDRVEKTRDTYTRKIIYKYKSDKGVIVLPSFRVWHVPGFGFNGLIGVTPLTYIRNLIGSTLGAEKMGATLFKNGLTFGGFLEHPGKFSKGAQENWEKQLKEKHEGVEKSHQVLILEEGMKYNKNHISPQDAQMLETLKYKKGQMATFFGLPPHKIGDLEHATFSNIEEQNIGAVIDSIRPLAVRYERSANRQLIAEPVKDRFFTKFNVDALLRGNFESRMRGHAIARNWGWESANDVLEIEDRNGIGSQGDIYMAPQNMMPADQFNNSLPKPPVNNQGKE